MSKFFKYHFISWIVCLLLIGFGLTACGNSTANATDSNSNYNGNMFTKIYGDGDFYVVYDNETKVMYAVSDGLYNRGTLTMLVNADGTPKLYKGE